MMAPTYEHHKVMLLLGPTRAGKGTIGRIMSKLVGPGLFTGASLNAFAEDSFLESLAGKTVAFDGDADSSLDKFKEKAIVGNIKRLTGQDEVSYGRKWKSNVSRTLPARLTVSCNSVPRMFDDSGALANRCLMLLFRNSCLGREDLGLFDALQNEIVGIASWALAGLARLRQAGRFTHSQAAEAELADLLEESAPLTPFLRACTTGSPSDVVSTRELYESYLAWGVRESVAASMGRWLFVRTLKSTLLGRPLVYYGRYDFQGGRARGFRGLRVTL